MKPAKTMHTIVAKVDNSGPWRSILVTADKAYAEATLKQFKEARVPARLETLLPKAPKGKPMVLSSTGGRS